MDSTAPIKDNEQFDDTPAGWASRWQVELKAAEKVVSKWHKQGDKIVKRFLDDRQDASGGKDQTRLNLFTSNVQTLRSILYGKIPQVDVDRRFQDSDDDVARVAAEIMQRVLNNDIEDPEDSYSGALLNTLDDRLLVGLGTARVRYEAEFEEQEVPALTQPDPVTGELIELAPAYTEEVKVDEDACVDYVYWKDFLWSPARTWGEVRWVAFRTLMTRDAGVERFGDKFKRVPMKGPMRGSSSDQAKSDPWERAEVWEIWCKEHEAVYWYVDGFDETLDIKDDPLGIEGFFPCPKPMFANLTTSGLLPRPEFVIAQDLYNEIDLLETRITILTEAVKVVGVYDKAADGVRRMLQEGVENDLIPVDNWALFAEKGGIRGQTDWLPIEAVTAAIDRLTAIRDNTITMLYQITGMSDIMRGGATQGGVTATEQAIKARFASTRIQALQDEFARFATELQRLKASVIVKHYDDQSIIKLSNIDRTLDAQFAPQAIQLLRSDFAEYRIEIKSEALSMTDYAAIKQERAEAIQGLAAFISAAQPLIEKSPGAGPVLLEIVKWGMGGFKGASQIESVLDQAIAGLKQELMQKAGQPPQPDPKVQAEQEKLKGELTKIAAQTEGDLQVIAAETGSEVTKQRAQAAFNMQETQEDMRAKGIEAAIDIAKKGGEY